MTYQPLQNPLPVQPAISPTTPNPDNSLGQIVVLLTYILAALRASNLNFVQATNSDGLTDEDVLAASDSNTP